MIFKTSKILNILRFGIFQSVELKDDYVLLRNKLWGIFSLATDAIRADKVVFFDEASGIFGKIIAFGYTEKTISDKRAYVTVDGEECWNYSVLNINGLKESTVKAIKEYLIKSGSNLEGKYGKKIESKKPIFRPIRWFLPRETFTFREDGVLHQIKLLTKTKSSFLPYEDIKVFSPNGWFRKRVNLLADVSVCSRERFTADDCKEIKTQLESHGAKMLSADGPKYRPSLLSFRRRNKTLVTMSDGVFFSGGGNVNYFPYGDIDDYSFKKRYWWSPFGTVTIESTRNDARDSSVLSWIHSSSHEIKLPGLFVWKWRILYIFSGRLKKTLKIHCKVAKKREKAINKAVRKADRVDLLK